MYPPIIPPQKKINIYFDRLFKYTAVILMKNYINNNNNINNNNDNICL